MSEEKKASWNISTDVLAKNLDTYIKSIEKLSKAYEDFASLAEKPEIPDTPIPKIEPEIAQLIHLLHPVVYQVHTELKSLVPEEKKRTIFKLSVSS